MKTILLAVILTILMMGIGLGYFLVCWDINVHPYLMGIYTIILLGLLVLYFKFMLYLGKR